MLKISLDLSSDAGYKDGKFSKVLPGKAFEFIPNKKDNTVIFNLGLVLLPIKFYHISEK